jgi:probable phosphoglycerate mutase
MRLYLIRHGETDDNIGRMALGRRDVPLNERGRAQALAVAGALRAHDGVAAVYASPLRRAVDTATPLAQALGLDIQPDDRLIEMDIGEMDGLTLVEARERYPDFMRRWLSDEVAGAEMPGGESLAQVQERAWPAIESFRDAHESAAAVVVTHNFVLLTVLCRALHLPLSRFRKLRHDLAALSVLELTAERQAVLTLNDRCHLE